MRGREGRDKYECSKSGRRRAHVVREHRGEQAEVVVLLDQVEVALRDVRAAVRHDRQRLPLRRRREPIQKLEARAYALLRTVSTH